MIVLGIETAGPRLGVALLRGDQPALERSFPNARTLGADLAPGVRDLLRDAGLRGGRCPDLVAVDVGPGSYTGLRIGIAAAKGLAFAWGRPLLGVSALDALEAAAGPAAQVLCALDASRGEIYTALFARTERGVERRHPGALRSPGELAELTGGQRAVVVGDAALAVVDAAPALSLAEPPLEWPTALQIATLARTRHLLGESQDAIRLEPIYYRQQEAKARVRQRSMRQA